MQFIRADELHALEGGSRRFRGRVWQTQAVGDDLSPGMRASRFVYEPGARSAWHTHDAEQVLYVESGEGLVGVWGHGVETVRAGDWVHVSAGEKHWHGAGPRSTLVHLAVNAAGGAQWHEHVDEPGDRDDPASGQGSSPAAVVTLPGSSTV